MKLQDKATVITGGVRGIGREIALLFAREGAKVAVNDIDEQGLEKIARELDETGASYYVKRVDVSKKEEVVHFMDQVKMEFGALDVLVNNAAYVYADTLFEFSEAEWDKVIAVGLKGSFLCSQAAAKIMLDQGGGQIINIASIGGILAMPAGCAYTTCKAGVIGLTKAMAMELSPLGIRVNAIAPGPIATELLLSNITKAGKQGRIQRIPMARLGEPAEIAKAALFLASEDSSYVAGHVLTVDGGMAAVVMAMSKELMVGAGDLAERGQVSV